MAIPRSRDIIDDCEDLGLYAPSVLKKEDWDGRPSWVIQVGKGERKTFSIPGHLEREQIKAILRSKISA
jgi:hypothetical protein